MASERVFANKINKKLNNNSYVYYGSGNNKNDIRTDDRNIYQKINDIFKSKKFVYKADVILTTKSGDRPETIIARNKQFLITSSNKLIPITEIIDIKFQ